MQASPVSQKSFLWQVPGRRISVDLRLSVVDQIAGEALDGMQTDGRGIEAGGLLLGRVRRDGGLPVVEVDEAEPIFCEHAAGPSLMLSASDRQSLEAQLKRRKGSVVGFYRTNTRREFAVTMEDVALMSWYFSRATDVFLLAHATREAPLRAAFVTWEGRSLAPNTPAEEFPFSSGALERRSHGLAAPPPPPAPPPRRAASRSGTWIAAGVIAAGVLGGAMFEKFRPSGAPSEPPTFTQRVARPAPVSPAPVSPAAVAPAPVSSPVADAVPPPAPPPKEEAPAEPATAPRPPDRAIVAESPARPILPPPAVTAPAMRSADRQLQEFVPPRAPRAPRAESGALPDLPAVAPPVASSLPQLVSAGSAPPPRVAVPPSVEEARSPVSVAVDAMSRVRGAKFVPPTAIRESRPQVPAALRQRLTRDVLINVRVYVDRTGKVEFAELLSDGTGENRELAALAVFASRRWQFAPATRDGKPEPAQAVLRFRFAPDGQ